MTRGSPKKGLQVSGSGCLHQKPNLVKLDGIVILQFHPFDLQTLMKSTDTVCIDDNIVDFPFANCFTGGSQRHRVDTAILEMGLERTDPIPYSGGSL